MLYININRKDDGETRIVKMAAPQIGNTEIPPEDGYTWRKYGQKEIMGSRFPRYILSQKRKKKKSSLGIHTIEYLTIIITLFTFYSTRKFPASRKKKI